MTRKDRWLVSLAMIGAALLGGFVATLASRGIPSAHAQAETKFAPGRLQMSAVGSVNQAGHLSAGAFVLDTHTGDLYFKPTGTGGDFTKLSTLK